MTYEKREEIFSKELLSIADIQELYGFSYQPASRFVRSIKTWFKVNGRKLRIDMEGKIHVQDYLEYLNIKGDNLRYADVKPLSAQEAV